jgi:hypothetical protein
LKQQNKVLKEQCAWKTLDAATSSLASQYECKLCMNEQIQVVIIPCGHAMSCRSCIENTNLCPICRCDIQNTTSIHFM